MRALRWPFKTTGLRALMQCHKIHSKGRAVPGCPATSSARVAEEIVSLSSACYAGQLLPPDPESKTVRP